MKAAEKIVLGLAAAVILTTAIMFGLHTFHTDHTAAQPETQANLSDASGQADKAGDWANYLMSHAIVHK